MARRRIEVEIIGNSRSLGAALGRSVGQLDSFADRVRAIGTQVHATGRTLTRGITIPVVGVAAAAVKMGLDFEGAMTNIRALVGASDRQMEDYREGVLELAKVTPQGPQELADALYFVTSAGFEGAAALDVLEASAKASAAGLGDTATVADAVTSAVNAYGEANLSASKATDVLLATVREGKAEPEELAQVIGRVVAPAEAMGVEFGELGGAVAALTLVMPDAAEAVTGLRGVLATFTKPADTAVKVLKDAGFGVKELQQSIRKEGLLETLQELRDRFGNNVKALRTIFPNIRAYNAFMALTGQNSKKAAEASKGVETSLGDTDTAFKKAGEDATKKFMTAWSKLQVMLIEASPPIIEALISIMEVVSGIAEAFDGLSPSTKKMIVGFALVAAAIGPILVTVGALITLIGVIASPIGVVIIALVALGAALVVLWTRSETFRRIAGEAWVYVQAQAQRFVEWFQGTAMPAIRNVIDFIKALWARFGPFIRATVGAALKGILGVARAWLSVLRNYIEFVLAVIRGDWSAAWNALKGIVRGLFDTVVAIIKGYVGLVRAAVVGIGRAIGGLAGQFLSWGLDLGRSVISGIVSAIRGAAGSIGGAIMDALPDPGGGVPFIPHFATGVKNFAGGVALVGERGPELLNLPRGSDVYNARQTRGMLGSPTGFEGLRIAGTLDLATGSLDGIIVGHLDAAGRAQRRRRRMGAE